MTYDSASTDAALPLSRGLPAVCFGTYVGGGVHTPEERVRLDSLAPGLKRLAFAVLVRTGIEAERGTGARAESDDDGLLETVLLPRRSAASEAPALACGKCTGQEMTAEVWDEIEIDRCTRCGGIFLDWGELTGMLRRRLGATADLDGASPRAAELDSRPAMCSRCGTPMHQATMAGGVRTDTCDACGGVILDRGELRRIEAALSAGSPA